MREEKSRLLCVLVGIMFMLTGLVSGRLAQAQVASGTITGIVRNEAGEGAPGADVALKNEDTGAERATHTRSDGAYVFTVVQPGTYTISVKLKGFVPASLGDIRLAVGQNVIADFGMHGEKEEGETSSTAPAPPPPAARNFYL